MDEEEEWDQNLQRNNLASCKVYNLKFSLGQENVTCFKFILFRRNALVYLTKAPDYLNWQEYMCL